MRKWIKPLFMVYILVLVKLIIFKHPYGRLAAIAASWSADVVLEGIRNANFIPFKTIRMYIEYADRLNSFENLLGNIAAFVPFGMIFPLIDAKRRRFLHVAAASLILVLGIELFQLFSAFGAFDVDDIILNCLGVILGYAIYGMGRRLFPSFDKRIWLEGEN